MPYITEEDRQAIADGHYPTNAGQLNYLLALEVDQYIEDNGLSYQTLNDIAGVLSCLDKEIYRRITVPYEDIKIATNGEVFKKAFAALKKVMEKVAGTYWRRG